MNIEERVRRPYAGGRSLMAIICCAVVLFPLLLVAGGDESRAQSANEVTKLTPMDYVDIYRLYSDYSVALDTGNGPARVATFTKDGTFSWFMSHHVPESMATVLKRTNDYGRTIRPRRIYHILTNIHITPTADGADGTCYAVLGYVDQNGDWKVQPGFYTDTLVKTPVGWRFKTRVFWTAGEDAKLPTIK
jgi:hypothetical protein